MQNKIAVILIIIFVALFIGGFFIFAHYNTLATEKAYQSSHPTESIQIPTQPAFKEYDVWYGKTTSTIYEVFTVDRNKYYVDKEQFDSLNIPLKIDDDLYLMPDGSYLSGLAK
jgi:hypothetical protein